ncbi:MAG: PQQ-binding-like beta-propeller repeat protein, partial [Bryobacteraceae bacterium]
TSAPMVDGERLIALVGGRPDAKVVAFDKRTGKELWRALSSEGGEAGYAQPVLVEAGGKRQVIVWHPAAVSSLDPATGKVNWEEPMRVNMGMTVATPVLSGTKLLVSAFYNGSMLLDVGGARAQKLWKSASESEIKSEGLHALLTTPVIDGDYIYGICSYGQFRCLNLKTGERVWETLEVTKENARWAAGYLVRHQDRYFINNDRGELIIARLTPEGYREMARTGLIQPTSNSGNRRELGRVHWSHPAYANRHIVVRNDEEVVSASLAK